MANRKRGCAHPRWQGGITAEHLKIRNSSEMKAWREAVFLRDDHTCQVCRKRGGDNNADHIKAFSLYPDERLNLDNGRTLCVPCHRQHGAKVRSGKIIQHPTGLYQNVQ